MRRILSIFALTLALAAAAQEQSAYDIIRSNPDKVAGLDYVYNFDVPALTKAPSGYKPFYIAHYGRHGSRYAYSMSFYKDIWEIFSRGDELGILTPAGREVFNRYAPVKDSLMLMMGGLADKGWEQQIRIAQTMYRSFPELFRQKPEVFACASGAIRSILSMSAFCVGLAQCDGSLRIREEQGKLWYNATNPRDGSNALAAERRTYWEFPFQMKPEEFMNSIMDVDGFLGKFFTDPAAACGNHSHEHIAWRFYIFAMGMQSLDYPADFRDLLSLDEWIKLWEADNYESFHSYQRYIAPDSAILEDMMKGLHAHAESGEAGIDLRFGHDHCLMPLLMMTGINEYREFAKSPEELKEHFRTFDSPMAANLQIILYRSRKAGRGMLVKVLLNGEEAHLPLDESGWPYYSWDEFAAHCDAVVRNHLAE